MSGLICTGILLIHAGDTEISPSTNLLVVPEFGHCVLISHPREYLP